MLKPTFLLGAILSLLTLSSAIWASEMGGVSVEQYAAGHKVFDQYCIRCHGKDADGRSRMAILYRKMFAPSPSNFTIGYFEHRPYDYLKKIIEDGGKKHNRSQYMPPFKGELSSKQITEVIYFIQTTGRFQQVIEKQ